MHEIDPHKLARVRQGFIDRGEAVSTWARQHKFSLSMVYAVLGGRQKCLRGEGHRIAIALGLKNKLPIEKNELNLNLERKGETS